MSKITVIQLLNKIANGEEVPEKIKYNGTEYKLNELTGWYQSIDVIGNVDEWFISKYRLNDIVEIIEDKEDINIQDIKELPEYIHIGDGGADADVKDEVNIKINEIIRAVKHLEKTKEDK